MYKKCKVVMLPTNKKAKVGMINLERSNREGYKLELIHYVITGVGLNPQHLYVLSDEKIEVGDWTISHGEVFKWTKDFNKNFEIGLNWRKNDKKIIATTDESLKISIPATGQICTLGLTDSDSTMLVSLPKPSNAFIQKYVEEYNKGNIITDVMVEYEANYGLIGEDYDGNREAFRLHDKLKVSNDNTITIRKVKDSWSREEVEEILFKYASEVWAVDTSKQDVDEFMEILMINEWIEENI